MDASSPNHEANQQGSANVPAVAARVIESASATTSPDNANSGNGAYVITGVCLAIMVAISVLFANAFGSALELIAGEVEDDIYDDYGIGLPSTPYDSYNQDPYDGQGIQGSLPVSVALNMSLAPYTQTIDADLPATDYSGTPADVRDFVRTIVKDDGTYASQVSDELNAAARDESAQAEHLEKALAACDAAASDFSARTVPEFDVRDADTVNQSAKTALADVTTRWQTVRQEIQLLADASGSGSEVSASDLYDADSSVSDATYSAATSLDDLLYASASR